MDTSASGYVEEMLARLQQQRAKAEEMRKELMAATASATSKDRMVTAKVGAQGQILSLSFHTTAYQSMAPAQLGTLLADTVNEAKAKLGEQFSGAMPKLGGVRDLLSSSVVGGSDLEELLEPLRAMRPGFAEEQAKQQRLANKQEEFSG